VIRIVLVLSPLWRTILALVLERRGCDNDDDDNNDDDNDNDNDNDGDNDSEDDSNDYR